LRPWLPSLTGRQKIRCSSWPLIIRR
jgi:hypothetical protein